MSQTDDKRKASVMVIDDDHIFRNMLENCLDVFNFHVLAAKTGQEALEQLQHITPDVILLDVLMPEMDGFELCSRLKANQDTRDIPVIFMTALTDVVDKVQGFEVGAVDYITKPINIDEVRARINTHLTLRKLQQALQNQIAERDRLIEDLSAFSHTVAHDLKNPLGHVAVSAEYMKDEWRNMPPNDVDGFMTLMAHTARKSCRIIDELLLLASLRLEQIVPTCMSMDDIVREALQRLAHTIEQNHAQIILPSAWPPAEGCGPWIEEVWANYISNAIKYGGNPPVIELGADPPLHGVIRFWIRDNGDGLAPEDQAKLFEPFTRLEQVRAKGSGLGLSIVRRIVEKLGGNVGVESQPGEGSLFYFTLPAAE